MKKILRYRIDNITTIFTPFVNLNTSLNSKKASSIYHYKTSNPIVNPKDIINDHSCSRNKKSLSIITIKYIQHYLGVGFSYVKFNYSITDSCL